MPTIPTVTLNNGVEMPILGFGVFQIPHEDTERAVNDALSVGYRHLDTAAAYQNEEAVGRAIAASAIPREDVFITTKLWIQDAPAEDNTRRAFEQSLTRLGLDHLDLYLIHSPSVTSTASGGPCKPCTSKARSAPSASRISTLTASSTSSTITRPPGGELRSRPTRSSSVATTSS